MKLEFFINQKQVSIEIKNDEMLVDVIRERLGLTGTKTSCREGECGACTVWLDGLPVNSCILPAAKAQGHTITTIEGLGNSELPHILQEKIAEFGASQCGFCTPGFVMAGAALLRNHPNATHAEIVEGLSGNLCRCSGYTRIVAAVESVADTDVDIPLPDKI